MTRTTIASLAALDWSAHADPARWPIAEHLYLAEAICVLGAALCEPWDGSEPQWASLPQSPLLPWTDDAFDGDVPVARVHSAFAPLVRSIISASEFAELELRHDERAWLASHVADPDGGPALPALLLRARSGDDADDPITLQHWDYAFTEAAERHHLSSAAALAMPPLARALVKMAFNGEIDTYARPTGGGEMVQLPVSVWALDDPLPRIAACSFNMSTPFDANAKPDHRIFIGEARLREAADALADTTYIPLIAEFEGDRSRPRPDHYERSTAEVVDRLKQMMSSEQCVAWTRRLFLEDAVLTFGSRADGIVFKRAWAIATEEFPAFNRAGRRLGS